MSSEKSLYERLGGIEGITTIVDDIIDLHFANPGIKARYMPLKENPEHFAEVRKHLIHFLAAGSGGPQTYEGGDMVTVHTGMNISKAEYMDVMDDIMAALDKNNISEDAKKDVLAIAYSLKGQMIGV
ncbi:group 1 truncated hemoglobin [Persicobacter diffluens]|uniref:Group 1 truncated hemoglobin n=1 Tax=Persicobacter diffluens TaxID=981 RepID=A0AAN5APN6_9BACT|nr:hypothetical protein PEDI_45850 [Persicobacter diffluens]